MSNEVEQAIEAARAYVMSQEEREEQRRSFAHGNVALHNPAVTREVIDRAADSLAVAQSSSYKPHPFVSDYMEDPRTDLYGLGINDCADAIAGRLEKARIRNAELEKLVEAADYLQHCRRRECQATAIGRSALAKQSVERASDTYDFLRGQVKL